MKNYREAFAEIKTFPRAFWVVIVATLMNQIGNMALVFLMLYLINEVHVTLVVSSIAFAVFSASMFASGIVSGNFIDYFGADKMMRLALFVNGCTLLFIPLVKNIIVIFLLCIIWGSAYGLYRPASQTFVSQLSKTQLHKLTFSLYRLVQNLGMSIGPALGGYLAMHSFQQIFFVNGAANLLAVFILLIGLMNYQPATTRSAERKIQFNLRFLKKDMALRLFVLGMIPIAMVFFQHESTLAIFLSDNLHLPLSFYGLLFTVNTLIIVFCELPLNIYTMYWRYRTNFMLGSFFITVGFAGLLFAHTQNQILGLTLFWTLGEMILYPAASSYIADIAPATQRGTYMSMFATCSNIGMLLGPWAGSLLMDYYGARSLWFACGIFGVLSIFLFSATREPKKN